MGWIGLDRQGYIAEIRKVVPRLRKYNTCTTETSLMEYTPEQLNYFRLCYIAFSLVPDGLRKIFKQEWDFLYKTNTCGEWKDTPQNGLDFYNREIRRKHTKNARYLPTIKNGNTTEWDCTCLFFAILYSDSIGTTLSLAVSKDVDDLRQFCNDIAHINEAELTDADFQNCVGKVIAVFNSLKLPTHDIVEVKNQTSFLTAEVKSLRSQVANLDNLKNELLQAKSDLQLAQSTTQKKEEQVEALKQEVNSRVESFCSLAFKPSHEVIERSNDVTRIMKKMQELKDRSNEARISTVYLSGIPGCGKSQIARQIGKEFFEKTSRKDQRLTFVATLNAEDLKTLADSYMSLARQLGVTEYALTNLAILKEDRSEEKIQHLKHLILPKIKQFTNWLLIADNVVDLSLIRSNLPPTASQEWGHGQVLITTQDLRSIPSYARHAFHESLTPGMQEDDAIELLKKVSQISNHEEVEKVAEVLEYQPLALAAAAFYVQTVVTDGSPTYSWTNYLKSLDDGRRGAKEEPLAAENLAYTTPMSKAIEIAINRASESDEVLRQTFLFVSLCANDSLPIEAVVDFVKAHSTGQTEELIRAKILKSCLITSLHGKDEAPCYLKMHNIVHEVLKTTKLSGFVLSEKVQCISAAIQTFYSLIEVEQKLSRESGYACTKLRNITSHCKALHEILVTDAAVKDVLVKELPGNVVSWLCTIASVCCDIGKPSDAITFSKSAFQSLNYVTSTREGDLLKAEVLCVRGKVFEVQCKRMLALSNYEEAMRIFKTIHGEESSDVARIYNTLGNLYIELQMYERAKDYHEKALTIRRTLNGENHPDVGSSYNSLGLVYSSLEEKNQAKEYYEKALSIAREVYGEKHVDLAAGYNNLGLFYSDIGQHKEAKEYHEHALIIGREIYGEEHPEVATIYPNLAFDHRWLKQYKEAKECDEKALMIRKTIYGEEHPEVAASYVRLGVDYAELRQPTEANECTEMALTIRKKISDQGDNFYSLRYGYLLIAQKGEAKGRNGKNLSFENKTYCEITNKKKHPELAESYHHLAVDYRELGQHNEAKECDKKALMIRKKIYGEEHPEVAASYHILADDYRNLEQHFEAKAFDYKALVVRKEINGGQHPLVAASYHILADDCKKLGQYNEAQGYDEKALMIRIKVCGGEHRLVAASYHILADDCRKLGKYNEAKECDEKALIIRKQIYNEEHQEVAESYRNLAEDFRLLKLYNEAKECDETALMIVKKIYEEEHPEVASSYDSLSFDYMHLGNYKEAKNCLLRALVIRKAIYGERHPDVKQSYENLRIYRKRKKAIQKKCAIL